MYYGFGEGKNDKKRLIFEVINSMRDYNSIYRTLNLTHRIIYFVIPCHRKTVTPEIFAQLRGGDEYSTFTRSS